MNRLFTYITLLLLLLAGRASSVAQVILRYGAGIDSGWGGASIVATPYVLFPKGFVAPYASSQITRVRIGLCQPATNVYLYIKNSPSDAKPLYRQKIGSLDAGWSEITLDTPFGVSGSDDIAIGYKASFAVANGVGYSKEVYSDGDFIYYNSENKWTSTGHSICIQAIVEGDNLPHDELLMGSLPSQTAPYGAESMTFTGWVRNVGANAIDGYTLRYAFDGEENIVGVDRHVDVNATDTFSIEVPATAKGNHSLWVAVNTVNGHADAYLANDTARATLTVRDLAFRRTVVCEEYTGLWCGFCPRGLVGMELMKEAYPGQFIAISAHGGDALEIGDSIPNYRPFTASCSGAPMCNVDRRMTGDPYNDINNLFAMEQRADNHIAYTLTAKWNADSTAIDVQSDFYSDIDIQKCNYNVAYTVTEDSITGYLQTNYYADGNEFYGWEKKAHYTDDVVFNDLARAVYPSYGGEPCHTEPMVAGEHYAHSYTVPVPPNVRNRRNIHVIGQIIDNTTGYIANAMSRVPEGSHDAGISSASTDGGCRVSMERVGTHCRIATSMSGSWRADVYTAEGVLTDSRKFSESTVVTLPEHGLSIVRISQNGHTIRTFKLK